MKLSDFIKKNKLLFKFAKNFRVCESMPRSPDVQSFTSLPSMHLQYSLAIRLRILRCNGMFIIPSEDAHLLDRIKLADLFFNIF